MSESRDTPQQAEFRASCRRWLAEHRPEPPPFRLPEMAIEVMTEAQRDYLCAWQRRCYAAGLVGCDYPVPYGGGGHTGFQRIASAEMSRAGVPFLLNVIGLGMAAPTILHHGSEAQKRRFLPPLLSGDEIWCQGFSEPGAGSDLASVRTSAVREGDHWLLNGHKVWTSLAHFAHWMILLARTSPEPKHEGLTFFLCRIAGAKGVTVRPLIKMTGEAGFNEVLFENAVVADDLRVDEVGRGWAVAMTTLLHERGAAESAGGGGGASLEARVEGLIALARATRRGPGSAWDDPVLRDRIVAIAIRAEGLRPVPQLLRLDDRGRHERDPAQHPGRAHPRARQVEVARRGARVAQPEDFGFGAEEELLRASARRLFAERAGIETLRARVGRDAAATYEADPPPAGFDRGLWQRTVGLGFAGLAVPAEAGGAGTGAVALAALAEEIGRAALPSPLLATLLASCVLREAEPAAAQPWLERIAAGAPASLATTGGAGSWEPGDTEVTAEDQGSGGARLRGTAHFVQDARKAAFFVVSHRSAAGVGLSCVEAGAPGLAIHPDRIADLTRDQAHLGLDGVAVGAAGVVARPGTGEAALRRALPALLTLVAADLCGAAEWQLQATAAYARVRTQFDRPLGFFQAVKHPLVDMMIAVDRARSLVYNAACAIDCEPDEALRCARMAKAAASDAAAFCSGRSVQLHGGIGFTWECDVHIYFKRQLHNQHYLGDALTQRARLAALLAAGDRAPA